jgi:ATP-dependent Lon protease
MRSRNSHDDDDSEGTLLPVITVQETEEADFKNLPNTLALLPLRNTVLFPGVVIPITVGRKKSIQLIKDAKKNKQLIGVVSQKDVSIEDPKLTDLSGIATAAEILRLIRMPDGNTTAIVQGKKRFVIGEPVQEEPYLVVKALPLDDQKYKQDKEMKALIASIKETAVHVILLSNSIPPEAANAIQGIRSPNFLINFIASNLNCETTDKQNLLEITDLKERARAVINLISKDLEVAELKDQIQSKARGDIEKQQREYYLTQQLKTIQEELGGISPEADARDIKERAMKMKWNKQTAEYFDKELKRLQRINPASPDYSVTVNHLDLMLELPWGEYTKDNFDLKRAEKILNTDHYGLEKIKKRILEYLAVIKLKNDMRSPILCLVGPPGVGKTSLGKSIAKALGRKYVRVSLGGVHDEAAIRGHRKTYIGAMPGKIIQSLKKVKSSNPVFLLDEIDKAGADARGDVSSALLEVLDPEQNNAFSDHYLEADYDLSRVMFVATANALAHVQPALLDRMEIISLSGYTTEEKTEIAKRHLLPKQIKEHGLTPKDLKVSSKITQYIIESYTREAGVRNLEKQIAGLCRGIAKMKVMDEVYDKNINEDIITKILGARKIEKDEYQGNDVAGVVTGLAWTSVGGEILFIEAASAVAKDARQSRAT